MVSKEINAIVVPQYSPTYTGQGQLDILDQCHVLPDESNGRGGKRKLFLPTSWTSWAGEYRPYTNRCTLKDIQHPNPED